MKKTSEKIFKEPSPHASTLRVISWQGRQSKMRHVHEASSANAPELVGAGASAPRGEEVFKGSLQPLPGPARRWSRKQSPDTSQCYGTKSNSGHMLNKSDRD